MNEKPIDKSAVDEVIGMEKTGTVNQNIKNDGSSLSEKIAVLEDTIEKIKNRIARRQKILNELESEFGERDKHMPENIQLQYENAKTKMRELENTYAEKMQELSILKSTLLENESL